MNNIYDLSFEDIEEYFLSQGERSFRAKQIWDGLYKHLYSCWDDFSTIPKLLREKLQARFSLGSLKEINVITTADGRTRKSLFKLFDGNLLESVLLRKSDRLTLCISTQSGCPVGCIFCATGNLGFFRNLTGGEIAEQAVYFQRLLKEENNKLTNIVFMGMGEPFLNYKNSLFSVNILNHKNGLNIGARRITISTIGILDKIISFADKEIQVNLSISLHAPNDELRRKLIPLAKSYSVLELINSCQYYFAKTQRRVTFEYVLIHGINDQPIHAQQLADLLKTLNSHVNLIALNPTDHYGGKAPAEDTIKEFGRILLDKGITLSIRESQGFEIGAGCGQLAGGHS